VTRLGVDATPVTAIRASPMTPSRRVSVTATAASAKSPLRRETSSKPQPVRGGSFASTISVTIGALSQSKLDYGASHVDISGDDLLTAAHATAAGFGTRRRNPARVR